MALRFIEGFDDGFMSQHGWALVDQFGTGRFGGRCWLAGQNHHQTLYLPAPLSGTVIVGFAFQHNNLNTDTIFSMGSINLIRNPSGSVSLYNGGTLLSTTATTPLIVAAWRYIEVKYVTSTGATTVRFDGTTMLTGTVGTVTTLTSISWAVTNNSGYGWALLDDVYVADTSGSLNNDFLGDVRVQTLLPNADGTYSQLTPSTGTSHSALVQEATPNTTDYNTSSTVGQKDSYQFQDLGANTAAVFGVEIANYSHKDAAGPAGFSNIVRIGSTDYVSTSQPLSTSWTPNRDILDANPATSAAWTASDVNNAEFGVQTT